MGATGCLARLRECVGHAPLLAPSAAGCIRDEEGRILLLRRSDGDNLWGFPGGADELPPMRPCCIAKAHDAFTFRDQAFFR